MMHVVEKHSKVSSLQKKYTRKKVVSYESLLERIDFDAYDLSHIKEKIQHCISILEKKKKEDHQDTGISIAELFQNVTKDESPKNTLHLFWLLGLKYQFNCNDTLSPVKNITQRKTLKRKTLHPKREFKPLAVVEKDHDRDNNPIQPFVDIGKNKTPHDNLVEEIYIEEITHTKDIFGNIGNYEIQFEECECIFDSNTKSILIQGLGFINKHNIQQFFLDPTLCETNDKYYSVYQDLNAHNIDSAPTIGLYNMVEFLKTTNHVDQVSLVLLENVEDEHSAIYNREIDIIISEMLSEPEYGCVIVLSQGGKDNRQDSIEFMDRFDYVCLFNTIDYPLSKSEMDILLPNMVQFLIFYTDVNFWKEAALNNVDTCDRDLEMKLKETLTLYPYLMVDRKIKSKRDYPTCDVYKILY